MGEVLDRIMSCEDDVLGGEETGEEEWENDDFELYLWKELYGLLARGCFWLKADLFELKVGPKALFCEYDFLGGEDPGREMVFLLFSE